MIRRLVFLLGVVGATTLGAASGHGQPADRAAPAPASLLPTGCPQVLGRPAPLGSSPASAGSGIWAAAGGRLAQVDDPSGTTATDPRAAAGTVVRHVVSVRGVGTAFVEDGAGTDTVVLVTEAGTVRIPQDAEAVNPALSPAGDLAWSVGTAVRVRDADSGRIVGYPVPRPGALAFSPVFSGHGLVVPVSAPPTGAVPEDDRLDDLWRVSSGGRWTRLTSFTADEDRWTAVRTPVASPRGGVDFVTVRGRGSATVEPSFFLMHVEDGRVRRVAALDGEMYLAGTDGRARLWNVPDIGAGRVDLVREAPDGTRTTIGCGATLMDPIDAVDPDHAAGVGNAAPDRGPLPPEAGTAVSAEATSEIGILVGDFSTPEAAQTALAAIRATGGAAAWARSVDASTAPHALRPGAYGVFVPLAVDADAPAALAAFRAALPAYASTSWVVTA
jgi:hypothetical protein